MTNGLDTRSTFTETVRMFAPDGVISLDSFWRLSGVKAWKGPKGRLYIRAADSVGLAFITPPDAPQARQAVNFNGACWGKIALDYLEGDIRGLRHQADNLAELAEGIELTDPTA